MATEWYHVELASKTVKGNDALMNMRSWKLGSPLVLVLIGVLGCSSGTTPSPADAGDGTSTSDTPDGTQSDSDVPDGSPLSDTFADGTNNDTTAVEAESDCGDEIDNNNDGLIDCDDPSCVDTVSCAPSCAVISALTCGASQVGGNDSDGATEVFSSYACNEYLYTGPEVAYSIAVDTPTYVTIALSNETDNTDVLVLDGADGACLSSRCLTSGLNDAVFLAQPNQTYFVVVDGYEGAVGTFDMSVYCEECQPNCTGKVCGDDGCGGTCGACADGQTCKSDQSTCIVVPPENVCGGAIEISVPYYDFGDTTNALDTYSALGVGCEPAGTSGGQDVVYSFTPSSTDVFRFHLQELVFDAVITIVSACDGSSNGVCLAGLDSPDEEMMEVGLQAGTTYYIVVDGTDELQNGAFALSVESLGPCEPSCSGCNEPDGCGGTCPCPPITNDTCAEAISIAPADLPAVIEGNTVTANDDYVLPEGACAGKVGLALGENANDVVYSFTPSASGPYTMSLGGAGETGFSTSLYVATDCEGLEATCLGAADVAGVGGESVTVQLNAGQSVFIVVDGGGQTSGPFTLHVAACVPQCDGKVCGDDSCGGTCGACGGNDYCFDGTCKAPGCGGVTAKGCCDGSSLVFCIGAELTKVDCTAGDDGGSATCGWNVQDQWYDCGHEGEDPLGTNALQCPVL